VRRIVGVHLCLLGVVGMSMARGDWRYLVQGRPDGEAKLFALEVMGHNVHSAPAAMSGRP